MTLGNIHVHRRSKVSLIQLVLMCKERYLVGEPECRSFFAPLIDGLKILENEGVDLELEKKVLGTVAYISGDNLGSHWVGDFATNFLSKRYFCRYCKVTKNNFQANPLSYG